MSVTSPADGADYSARFAPSVSFCESKIAAVNKKTSVQTPRLATLIFLNQFAKGE